MAVLQSIRKNYWIIFMFIVCFVFTMILEVNGLFFFLKKKDNIIGKINKEPIYLNNYLNTLYLLKQFRQNVPDVFLQEESWKSLVYEMLLNQEAKKLGIQWTEKDFWNAISHQSIYSYISEFKNSDGSFNIKKFLIYLKKLENNTSNNYQIYQDKNLWNYERNNIPKRILSKKYIEMLMYGLNSTSLEAKRHYLNKNWYSIIDYILIPYSEIEKKYNFLSVKNWELINYIKKNKFLYNKENIRTVSFVIAKTKPSVIDKQYFDKKIHNLLYQLKYINDYHDLLSKEKEYETVFDENFYLKKNLPYNLKKFINDQSQNYNPIIIQKDNVYLIAKITGKKRVSEFVTYSHILISHKNAINSCNHRTKEEAYKTAYNLYKILKNNPSKFIFYVKKISDDSLNAKIYNGKLGSMQYNYNNLQSVRTFDIFDPKIKTGTIKIIETKFGYHIIKIDNKSHPIPAYKFLFLTTTLIPSQKTKIQLLNNVQNFLMTNKNKCLNQLINNARTNKYETIFLKDIKQNDYQIKGLNTEIDRKIINWSFDKIRKEGDSNILYNKNKDYYIIVYLSTIKQPGYSILEIKNDLIYKIRKNKIHKFFKNKIQYKSLNLKQLSKLFHKNINHNLKINFNQSWIDNYKEPKVIGSAFSLKENVTSKPIFGQHGIFFIKQKKYIVNVIKHSYNISNNMQELNNILRENMIKMLGNILMNQSDIKDYRNR
ncbi:SurA N-terminal domain-containing protein [Blattabacterium cuenoti]|uniref:SurA N-terminal domain-containing protein n=1 Tax=Blattabacterium cuenoti TaxID=1653831 RepID=UPI00163BEFF5|nr:SurA N-terminal domain-containing protein [Blattabacterium cuenoti]